jgi:hypothetical protein
MSSRRVTLSSCVSRKGSMGAISAAKIGPWHWKMTFSWLIVQEYRCVDLGRPQSPEDLNRLLDELNGALVA